MTTVGRGLIEELGSRRDLPTYLGGLVATLSWLTTVGTTVGDSTFNTIIFTLTVIGFGVSFWLRGFETSPQWPAIKRGMLLPSAVVRVAFMLVFVLPGLANLRPFAALVPDVARASSEWLIGTGFMWAMALYSFGLVSDGLVAFGSVLGLSMMGLMASTNVNPEIGVQFLFYLFGNVLLLSNMTLAHHSPVRHERTSSAALARWVGDQVIVAGVSVALTAVVGMALAMVLQRISPSGMLSQINLPNTPGRRSAVSHSYGAFGDRMELGVGLVALPTTPVFVASEADDQTLWRRRVYDVYVARMWRANPPMTGITVPIDRATRRAALWSNREVADSLQATRELRPRVRMLQANAWLAAPALVTEMTFGEHPGERLALDRFGNPQYRAPSGQTIELVCRVAAPTPEQLATARDVPPNDWRGLGQVPTTARRAVREAVDAHIDRNAPPGERARQIQAWLESAFTYDATVSIPSDEYDDAMAFFLTEKRGACDLIASAMALLAREVGIPARVAVGYSAGEPQPDGSRVVRASNAHAWAELYFDGFGWVAFNPAVPGADVSTQAATGLQIGGAQLRARLSAVLSIAVGLWLLGYGGLQWRKRLPAYAAEPGGDVERLYHQTLRALRRRRLPRRLDETPRRYYTRLRRECGAALWLLPFERLTALYERRRYLLGPIDLADMQLAETALREMRRLLRRYRPARR